MDGSFYWHDVFLWNTQTVFLLYFFPTSCADGTKAKTQHIA